MKDKRTSCDRERLNSKVERPLRLGATGRCGSISAYRVHDAAGHERTFNASRVEVRFASVAVAFASQGQGGRAAHLKRQ